MGFDAFEGCLGKANDTKLHGYIEEHIQIFIIFISIAVSFFAMQHWPDFGGNALRYFTGLRRLDGLLVYRAGNHRQIIDYGAFSRQHHRRWSWNGHKFVLLFERLLHPSRLFEAFQGFGRHKEYSPLRRKCVKGEGIFLKAMESVIEHVIVIACLFAQKLHANSASLLTEPLKDVTLRGGEFLYDLEGAIRLRQFINNHCT